MDSLDALELAQVLAQRAGALVAEARSSGGLDLSHKRGVERFASAHLEADQLICDGIREGALGHRILSEDSPAQIPARAWPQGPLWVVDPINGTVNDACGHSQVAVSIAYIRGWMATEADARVGHLRPAPPEMPAELWGSELVAACARTRAEHPTNPTSGAPQTPRTDW